jgi:hypothetical protein
MELLRVTARALEPGDAAGERRPEARCLEHIMDCEPFAGDRHLTGIRSRQLAGVVGETSALRGPLLL